MSSQNSRFDVLKQELLEAASTLDWKNLGQLICNNPGVGNITNEIGQTLLHVIICHETIKSEKKRLTNMVAALQSVISNNQQIQQIVNARDKEGKTALHIACSLDDKRFKQRRRQYIKLLNLLIDAGADVNMEFKDGIRPLHIVHESPWAVKHLIAKGANVNAQDSFKRSPLIWMLRNPHFPPVKMIPVSEFGQAHYRFFQADYMGNSEIHYAIIKSRFASSNNDVIRLLEHLIQSGAGVNAQNRRRQTPFFMIIHKTELMELAECLLSNGAEVDLWDADGYTVVSIAAMMSNIDYLKLLIPKLSKNYVTPTGETVEDLVKYYILEDDIDDELMVLLSKLNLKEKVVTKRTYEEPYSVWGYIQRLLSYLEIVSLYVVDTFCRYQGGRSIFSDFFLNIGHSAKIRRMAMDFKQTMMSWDGHPDRLTDIIEQYSIGSIHDTTECCHCPKEECLIAYKVREAIENLMIKVKELDTEKRFLLEVIPVGSIIDDSKIFLPDEFDFLVVFQHFEKPQLESIGRENLTSLVEDFRLRLVQAMQQTDKILLEQRESKNLPLEFLFVDCELRRVCLNIRMIWRGEKYQKLHLSIDLTPVFQFDGWDDRYGPRPLRPFNELPGWYQRGYSQGTGYFRPVYNYSTVPPFTPIAENKTMHLDTCAWGRMCLRLLKLIIQTDFIIDNTHAPNSYCLKLAFFHWCTSDENKLPERSSQIAGFVANLARKFTDEWADSMPYFVTHGNLTTRFRFLFRDLLEVVERHSYQPSPES